MQDPEYERCIKFRSQRPDLRKGHRWLPWQEKCSKVSLHLVLLLSILLHLSRQAIILLNTLCIPGVVHLQHIIPVLELGFKDLLREKNHGMAVTDCKKTVKQSILKVLLVLWKHKAVCIESVDKVCACISKHV